MTSIATGSLSSTSVSLTSFSGYNSLLLEISNPFVNNNTQIAYRFNSNSNSVYSQAGIYSGSTSVVNGGPTTTARGGFATYDLDTSAENTSAFISISDYDSTNYKNINMGFANASGAIFGNVRFNSATAITSIQITTSSGTATFSGGTYILWGIK
jgi:hypothetical protein